MEVLSAALLLLPCLLSFLQIQAENSNNVSQTEGRYLQGNNTDESAGVNFLSEYEVLGSEHCNTMANVEWNYGANLTDHNKKLLLEEKLKHAVFSKEVWKNATRFAWKGFSDPLVKRQFKELSILGAAALPTDKLEKLEAISTELESNYGLAKVCEYRDPASSSPNATKCDIPLEPDLTRILATSTNYDELLHVWKSWRDAAGKPVREKYMEFIELQNEAARLNGFKDNAEFWLKEYDDNHIEEDFEKLWQQLTPLYEQLHAYVRRKLIKIYGEDKIRADGAIPAHLLGNMWAQTWGNLVNNTIPFPGRPTIDVTETMLKQNFTALKLFQLSDEFYQSLGLKPMPEEFWQKSIIEKPTDREIVCHASAWDFCNKKDFRVKQCTDINMVYLQTTHHEMGHIQYYLQYVDQPISFRGGANPGFHEAIGDLIALSVETPGHLTAIGLLKQDPADIEIDINFLYTKALDKVAILPFSYLMDQWRWKVFRGQIGRDNLNSQWWELREKYQGVSSPIPRSEEDFDPAAKYHISSNVEYARYFVAAILQFQFHKELCNISGHTGPLHKCDIYRSKEAGARLSEVLKLGASKPWPEVLGVLTGGRTTRMDASPILEYFQPLLDWLTKANENEYVGWKRA